MELLVKSRMEAPCKTAGRHNLWRLRLSESGDGLLVSSSSPRHECGRGARSFDGIASPGSSAHKLCIFREDPQALAGRLVFQLGPPSFNVVVSRSVVAALLFFVSDFVRVVFVICEHVFGRRPTLGCPTAPAMELVARTSVPLEAPGHATRSAFVCLTLARACLCRVLQISHGCGEMLRRTFFLVCSRFF